MANMNKIAKGWEAITSDGDSLQLTTRNKSNSYSASMNICEKNDINFSQTPTSPLGGKDLLSMEVPFPLNLIPVVASKIPTGVPLQEYLPWLPTAKKALAISLLSTASAYAVKEVKEGMAKKEGSATNSIDQKGSRSE